MKLSSLLEYDSIVIQCHDNPDADAICSGYVLYRYFSAHGKKVRFIYSGNFESGFREPSRKQWGVNSARYFYGIILFFL